MGIITPALLMSSYLHGLRKVHVIAKGHRYVRYVATRTIQYRYKDPTLGPTLQKILSVGLNASMQTRYSYTLAVNRNRRGSVHGEITVYRRKPPALPLASCMMMASELVLISQALPREIVGQPCMAV